MKPTSPFWSGGGGGGGRDGSAAAAAGCLSKLLRRMLCFSSLPLSSFDHFKEEEREEVMAIKETPSSPPRRRIPAYRELEDENFFILSFEKSRVRRSGRNSSRRENKENENPEGLLLQLKNPCKKSEDNTARLAGKDCLAPAKLTFENEDESENSSPNSVLEFVGFSADHKESASPGEVSRLANSRTRRPLSEELDNCGGSMADRLEVELDQEGGNRTRLRNMNCWETLDEVGKMAAMDTMRSSWLHEEILQDKVCFVGIGRVIASNIFDHLVEELVISLAYNNFE